MIQENSHMNKRTGVIHFRYCAIVAACLAIGNYSSVLAVFPTITSSYEVKKYDEYNDYDQPHLLSNQSSDPVMPEVRISIVATLLRGPDPLPNQTVVFTSSDTNNLSVVGGTWPVSLTTDSKGQAGIEVVSQYGQGAEIEVRCTWIQGAITRYDTTVITVDDEAQSTTNCPTWTSTALSNPCAIKYSESLSWMPNDGIIGWNMTNRIDFQEATLTQIEFSEYLSTSDETNAYTTTSLPRLIKYNTWRLNGDSLDEYNPSYFPPASWRHHLRSTSAHEIGHALGLDHNSPKYSLMFFFLERYFLHEVQEPVSGELGNFNNMYPNACSA